MLEIDVETRAPLLKKHIFLKFGKINLKKYKYCDILSIEYNRGVLARGVLVLPVKKEENMYLLKKIGPSLIAMLVLSVLLLVFVVLTFEKSGIFLPSFSSPESAETTDQQTSAHNNSVNNNQEIIFVPLKEDYNNE